MDSFGFVFNIVFAIFFKSFIKQAMSEAATAIGNRGRGVENGVATVVIPETSVPYMKIQESQLYKSLTSVQTFLYVATFVTINVADALAEHREQHGVLSYRTEVALLSNHVNLFASMLWAAFFPQERLIYLMVPRLIAYFGRSN